MTLETPSLNCFFFYLFMSYVLYSHKINLILTNHHDSHFCENPVLISFSPDFQFCLSFRCRCSSRWCWRWGRREETGTWSTSRSCSCCSWAGGGGVSEVVFSVDVCLVQEEPHVRWSCVRTREVPHQGLSAEGRCWDRGLRHGNSHRRPWPGTRQIWKAVGRKISSLQ